MRCGACGAAPRRWSEPGSSAFFVLVAIFAPFLAPYDPTRGNLADSYLPPSAEHWFGTNIQGQDVLSRIIFGSRLTLGIAVLSVVIGVGVGAFFGSLAGYFRGWVDSVIMRGVDIMLSIPGLLLAIGVVTFLGRGVPQIAVAIAIVNVPIFARLLRASLLSLREADYVVAARAVGVRGPTLLVRHMLPNAIEPADRAGHPGPGDRRGRRRRARLPGARSTGSAHAGVGEHAVGHVPLPQRRGVPRLLPGRRHRDLACSASTCSATACARPSIRSCADDPPASRRSSRRSSPCVTCG